VFRGSDKPIENLKLRVGPSDPLTASVVTPDWMLLELQESFVAGARFRPVQGSHV